jgi:hypothetical protein
VRIRDNDLFFLGTAYFEAIVSFGVENILKSIPDRDLKIAFIQTHLSACSKEKNTWLLKELVQLKILTFT